MISIRKTMSDLDDYRQQRDLAFDCYLAAIRNTAHYAVELDDAITPPHRKYLVTMAEELSGAGPGAPQQSFLEESRATFRGLLRDYRDKASHYIAELREQFASTARALQQIVDSLTETDGDHDTRLRTAVTGLREAAAQPEGTALRGLLVSAADTIQQSVDQIKREHEVAIAQFQVEIRALHKRIDALESAACLDSLTKLFTRREMEDRIRSAAPGSFCLLLVKVSGLRTAELEFDRDVAAELAGAFSRRLRNSLPESAVIGRWSDEEFIAITQLARTPAVSLATHLAEHLSGSYACLRGGKTVRPALRLRVGVVDSATEAPDRILHRIAEILTGRE